MADIKQFEVIPVSGGLGTKIINFGNMDQGLSIETNHLRPVFARRSQSGALTVQAIIYNKKIINISGVTSNVALHVYFKALFESGINSTLKLWYEDPENSYAETEDFNAIVSMLEYGSVKNENDNVISISMLFSEI